jgi:hypothetical protein
MPNDPIAGLKASSPLRRYGKNDRRGQDFRLINDPSNPALIYVRYRRDADIL